VLQLSIVVDQDARAARVDDMLRLGRQQAEHALGRVRLARRRGPQQQQVDGHRARAHRQHARGGGQVDDLDRPDVAAVAPAADLRRDQLQGIRGLQHPRGLLLQHGDLRIRGGLPERGHGNGRRGQVLDLGLDIATQDVERRRVLGARGRLDHLQARNIPADAQRQIRRVRLAPQINRQPVEEARPLRAPGALARDARRGQAVMPEGPAVRFALHDHRPARAPCLPHGLAIQGDLVPAAPGEARLGCERPAKPHRDDIVPRIRVWDLHRWHTRVPEVGEPVAAQLFNRQLLGICKRL